VRTERLCWDFSKGYAAHLWTDRGPAEKKEMRAPPHLLHAIRRVSLSRGKNYVNSIPLAAQLTGNNKPIAAIIARTTQHNE
jgi:hypothetical protein